MCVTHYLQCLTRLNSGRIGGDHLKLEWLFISSDQFEDFWPYMQYKMHITVLISGRTDYVTQTRKYSHRFYASSFRGLRRFGTRHRLYWHNAIWQIRILLCSRYLKTNLMRVLTTSKYLKGSFSDYRGSEVECMKVDMTLSFYMACRSQWFQLFVSFTKSFGLMITLMQIYVWCFNRTRVRRLYLNGNCGMVGPGLFTILYPVKSVRGIQYSKQPYKNKKKFNLLPTRTLRSKQ